MNDCPTSRAPPAGNARCSDLAQRNPGRWGNILESGRLTRIVSMRDVHKIIDVSITTISTRPLCAIVEIEAVDSAVKFELTEGIALRMCTDLERFSRSCRRRYASQAFCRMRHARADVCRIVGTAHRCEHSKQGYRVNRSERRSAGRRDHFGLEGHFGENDPGAETHFSDRAESPYAHHPALHKDRD